MSQYGWSDYSDKALVYYEQRILENILIEPHSVYSRKWVQDCQRWFKEIQEEKYRRQAERFDGDKQRCE